MIQNRIVPRQSDRERVDVSKFATTLITRYTGIRNLVICQASANKKNYSEPHSSRVYFTRFYVCIDISIRKIWISNDAFEK